MCGIAGYAGTDNERALRVMCDTLAHRGPDDAGIYTAPGVGLGSRRLSIIDLAGGHQPLSNEDGSIWITFNGEIYDYAELTACLAKAGHTFRTHSDTETIIHAYETYGDDCVRELNGMFAFSVWDSTRARLLLARDHFGIKPLYYTILSDRTLVWASEIKALLKFPGVTRDLDLAALDQYLRLQYVPAPRTIFARISKLSAGHRLIWENETARVERYWTPRFTPQQGMDETDWLRGLDLELMQAVERQRVSEAPLGAFLSGGVDSTAVVVALSRLADRPIETFTIGFQDARYDETEYAAQVARHLGTRHHHRIVPRGVDQELFAQLVAQLDEPLADSSFIPTYHVSKLARQHVTVALSGDGGDETFAGYAKYRILLDWRTGWGKFRIPVALRENWTRLARRLPTARRTALMLSMSNTAQFAEIAYRYGSFDTRALYSGSLAEQAVDAPDLWSDIEAETRAEAELAQMQHVDFLTYLPEDILMKVDKMSMAVSLEARVPLLDVRLQEFAMHIPTALKAQNGTPKYLLRRWLRGKVPDAVLDRPKVGFAPTLSYWLGDEWQARAAEQVRDGVGVRRGLFQRAGIDALIRERDLLRLWNLWVFETWAQAYDI